MVKIILVTAQWCHFCPTAKQVWKELKEKFDFEYEEVDLDTPEGEKLVEKFSIASVPTTIIDDKIVFVGVPDRDKASKTLEKPV